jgi:hypothetical protein
MKTMLKRFNVGVDEPSEEYHLLGTIGVVFILLTFVGATFYVLISSYA